MQLAVLWIVLAAGSSSLAFAQADAGDNAAQLPEIAALRIGFDGYYKVGYWTEAVVTLSAPGANGQAAASPPSTTSSTAAVARVEITLPDGDEVESTFASASGPPSGTDEVRLWIKPGRTDAALRVAVISEDGRRRERIFRPSADGSPGTIRPALFSSQTLIVAVGAPLDWAPLLRLNRLPPLEQFAIAHVPDAADLPRDWLGYEGADALFLVPGDSTLLGVQAPAGDASPPWLNPLVEWVRLGGRLVVLAGRSAHALFGAEQPLAALAPGELAPRPIVMRRTAALESYTDLNVPLRLGAGGIQVPQWNQPRGIVELEEGALPLVIRTPTGFGEIVTVPLDLDAPPLSEWEARGSFFNRLLGRPALGVTARTEQDAGGQLRHTGLTDLAGQMRAALDQFAGVRQTPFWLVLGALLLYIVLVGAADFALVHWVLKRRTLTWLTMPAIVVAVCLAAWWAAQASRGGELRVNQVDLIDLDLQSGLVRGTVWANVFSPQSTEYDLGLNPPSLEWVGAPQWMAPGRSESDPPQHAARVTFAWQGLPGSALGGMARTSTPGDLFRSSYRFSPRAEQMHDVPIPVGASKSFVARWTEDVARLGGPPIEIELQSTADGSPRGRIRSRLPFDLRNCLLAYGRWAIEIEELTAGQAVVVDYSLPKRDLRDQLTGRRMEFDNARNQFRNFVREYDSAGLDPEPILRQMMLHEAAGGIAHARLPNQYQSYLDLSTRLQLEQGVFFGFAEQGQSHLLIDGRPAPRQSGDVQLACYRVLFPIDFERIPR